MGSRSYKGEGASQAGDTQIPRFVISARAEADAADIWEYIAWDNVQAADKLLDDLTAAYHTLSRNPLAGRLRPELAKDLRSFPVGSFVVLYKPLDDGVQIVRVVHGTRDLNELF